MGFKIIASVFPTCAADITTTFFIPISVIASIISFWYGAFDVRHLPGSADASEDSCRNLSAHSDNFKSGGGCNTEYIRLNNSAVFFFILYRVAKQLLEVCQFFQCFINRRFQQLENLCLVFLF